MTYNYFEAIKNDVREYIDDNINISDYTSTEELEEYLNDTLRTVDSVTGNASGSYTFNAYYAEEYLCHNWDLLAEALSEFGLSDECILDNGAEWCDVTIRYFLLPGAISEVLEDFEIPECEVEE